jgi:REP element-mobilizing transposase RayT
VTKPRCVLPNIIYFLTRRCSERRFFLRPDPEVKQIFEYLLGLLANEYGIQIHAYVVMSNHYLMVVTDTEGRLPDFQRDFNSLLARSINAFRIRSESFWDRRSYSRVKLLEDRDVLDKMGYTLANPVEARLVDRARQWGGATSARLAFGEVRRIARPDHFFSDAMPPAVEFELTRPRCYQEFSDEELLAHLQADVARREAEHGKLGNAMGMARVKKQSWKASPESEEPRRQLQPTVASHNKEARIEALQRAKEWLRAYKDALARFVAGVRDVEFPQGTWWMCVRLRCRVVLE